MPIDIEQLVNDPDYKQLSPERQREVLQQAIQRNTASEPGSGLVPGQTLQVDIAKPAGTPAGVSSPPPPEQPSMLRRIATFPGVLPTVGGLVTGGSPSGVIAGEMARQLLLPRAPGEMEAKYPGMPRMLGLGSLAQSFGEAIKEPGVLPAAATGGLLPFASQAAGLGGAVGRTAAGASAATLGEMGRRALTGNPMTPEELPMEAGLNTVVQGAVEGIPEVARTLMQRSYGGRVMRGMAAAQEATGMPEAVYHPVDRQTINQQFALVRASGDQVKPSSLRNFLRDLSPDDERTLLRQIRQIDAGPNYPQGLGGRLATNIEAIMRATNPAPMDIGELAQLGSQMRLRAIRAEQAHNGALTNLLSEFKDAVDTAIDTGAMTSATSGPLLREARANYARYRSADELGAMVTKHSRYQPGTSAKPGTQVLDLAGFRTDLEQGTSRFAESVRTSLERTPGAWDEAQAFMNNLGRHYEELRIPDISGSGMISMARRILAEVMLSPRGRDVLSGFLAQGNGVVTTQQLAILGALVQHEALTSGQVRRSADAIPSQGLGQ